MRRRAPVVARESDRPRGGFARDAVDVSYARDNDSEGDDTLLFLESRRRQTGEAG